MRVPRGIRQREIDKWVWRPSKIAGATPVLHAEVFNGVGASYGDA
jgi:hypothetical protein